MIQQIGGRKFVGALVMLILGGLLVWFKGDIPPNAMSFLEFIFGALVTGNSVSKITNLVAAKSAPIVESDSEPSSVDLTPLTQKIDELNSSVTALSANDGHLAENISIVQQTLSLIIKKVGIDKMPDPQ